MFDVSSTSGGGTDSSNITRIFRVEENNAETYFVVQVNYTLSISTVYRPTVKSVQLLCKHHDHDSFNTCCRPVCVSDLNWATLPVGRSTSLLLLSVHMEYQPSHLPLKLQYMVVR